MATLTSINQPVAHVRYNGRSLDVPMAALDLSIGASNVEIKSRLAQWLDIPARNLNDYVLDRHPNGNVTLRPEAVFG